MPAQTLHQRKQFLQLTAEDEAQLQKWAIALKSQLPQAVDTFYAHLMRFPEMRAHFPSAQALERHKGLLSGYFDRLTAGNYDIDYGKDRERVGLAHARINLPPGWYLGAYSCLLTTLLPQMLGADGSGEGESSKVAGLLALLKVIFLDMGIAIDSYIALRDQLITGLRGYSTAFTHLPYGTLVVTPELDVLFANHAFADLLDCQAHELTNQPLALWLDTTDLVQQAARTRQQQHDSQTQQLRLWSKRLGIPVRITSYVLPVTSPDQTPLLLFTVRDMRQQEQLQRELLQAQQVAQIGTWQTLFDGLFHLSDQAAILLGSTANGQPQPSKQLLASLHPDDQDTVCQQWQKGIRQGQHHFLVRQQQGQKTTWLEVRSLVECDATGLPLRAYGTLQDVSKRQQAEQHMQYLANFDALTGLANRQNGLNQLQSLMDQADKFDAQVVVMFADLDRFKEVNDTLGHGVGDQVLQSVAKRLQSIQGSRDILARIGGDEFMLARLQMPGGNPLCLAQELVKLLDQPLILKERAYPLGVSIGVSIYPRQAVEISELLHCADLAMYQIKAQGGGCLLYTPEMGEQQQRRVAIAQRLEQAMAQSRLQLHYQPKVDIHTGQLCGVEALARWYEPEWGWISPAEFIPVAEERGLIAALDSWGLDTAARQWKCWKEAGYTNVPSIAVNISATEISMGDEFAQRTLRRCRSHGVPPQALELEITESALAHNADKSAKAAQTLVDMGFTLAIDDFGTGYSSLARLHNLPLNHLKIDMTFVRNMHSDKASMAIITTIISMAHALNLRTIAEGVETQEQLETLRSLRCDMVQGYLFSKPLPAQELAAQWLRLPPG